MNDFAWQPTALRKRFVPVIDLHAHRGAENMRTLRQRYREVFVVAGALSVGLIVCLPLTVQAIKQRMAYSTAQKQAAQVETRMTNDSAAGVETEKKSSEWRKFAEARTRREGWAALLKAMAVCVPKSLFLEQLTVDTNPEKSVEKKEAVTIRGACESMTDLNAFVDSLRKLPFFTNVALQEANSMTDIAPHGVEFRIEATGNGALIALEGKTP